MNTLEFMDFFGFGLHLLWFLKLRILEMHSVLHTKLFYYVMISMFVVLLRFFIIWVWIMLGILVDVTGISLFRCTANSVDIFSLLFLDLYLSFSTLVF